MGRNNPDFHEARYLSVADSKNIAVDSRGEATIVPNKPKKTKMSKQIEYDKKRKEIESLGR